MRAAVIVPWQHWLSLGLGALGLPADRFWALTPREFLFTAGLTRPHLPTGTPTRAELAALIARFPDHPIQEPSR